jgi:integrase
LEWGDIDFRDGFIEVRRAYTKGQLTTPKNGKSRRVDMSHQLSEILKELRTDRKREALAKGWGEVPELVFLNYEGRMINSFNLRPRVFHAALEKAGLRRIRIHYLRHTFASLLLQNGESIVYVKDQLGHGSISITVDTYGHLVPGANRQAVDRLDDNFSGTYKKNEGCV